MSSYGRNIDLNKGFKSAAVILRDMINGKAAFSDEFLDEDFNEVVRLVRALKEKADSLETTKQQPNN